MKIPAAKAAVDKEWEKLEKISAWNLTRVRSKKEVIDEARTSGAKVHVASLMDIFHLKNAELETKDQKYTGRVPVINHGHDRSGRLGKKRDHELERGPTKRRPSNARQLGCVFQDMKPPKSILRKSTNVQRPIQRVKFTKAVARHADIRDQNPSLGLICPGEPHQRNPNAPKFEDRSQEETE